MDSSLRFRIGRLFFITAIIALIFATFVAIRRLDPFPVLEFSNASGVEASGRLHRWYFSVPVNAIRNVSHKSVSSRDSYSAWTVFEVNPNDAAVLTKEVHEDMATLGAYIRSQNLCEQRTRQINMIAGKAPISEPPKWWANQTGPGLATENMLWSHDPAFGGTAQGCYSIYDQKKQRLWVYEFAAEGEWLWSRGSEAVVH